MVLRGISIAITIYNCAIILGNKIIIDFMNGGNKNIFLIVAAVVIIVAGIGWWLFLMFSGGLSSDPNKDRGMEGDPLDVTLNFYEKWLIARQSTTTDPYSEKVNEDIALSAETSASLAEYEGRLNEEGLRDPVLCQTSVPESLRTVPSFTNEERAQFLVLSATKGMDGQASVSLEQHNGRWMITKITCGAGEQDPNQGEFTFDKEGLLLKNVPEPLDSQYWHIVFEQNGEFGHAAPLFLGNDSVCISTDGVEELCSDSMFTETERVHVQGQMSEAGVEVKRIEFMN